MLRLVSMWPIGLRPRARALSLVIPFGKRANSTGDSVLRRIFDLRRIVISGMRESHTTIHEEDSQGSVGLVPSYWFGQKLSQIVQIGKRACQNIRYRRDRNHNSWNAGISLHRIRAIRRSNPRIAFRMDSLIQYQLRYSLRI